MRKFDFIDRLSQAAGISSEQASTVNDIIESHSLIGKNSKAAATTEIAEALGIDQAAADSISNTAYDIIAEAMKEKLKHPFGPKG